MKSENRIAEERRARLRVLPGGLLEKERASRIQARGRAGEGRAVPLFWRVFLLGIFSGVLATVMLAYIRLVLRF